VVTKLCGLPSENKGPVRIDQDVDLQATATINVDKAIPTITWASPADITYGTALSSTQLDATASVPGTFTYTPSVGTFLTAESGQTLSVYFSPTDTTDYAPAASTSTINVEKATPTLNVSAPCGVYNGYPFAASVTIEGITHSAEIGEDVTPILTYYIGSSASGMSLGSTPPTDVGTYTVVANVAGTTDYVSTQSSPSTFTIVRGSAAIALTSSVSSAVFGQSVSFVATVETPGTSGGTVTFSDGGTPLASVPVDGSSQATMSVTSLDLGSHAITATYSGDANIVGVQSSATALSVAADGTRVVLVPQPIFRKKKQLKWVGLKAEIEPLSPGGGLPTGTVTFELTKKHRKKLKVKTLGTVSVNGGAATLTLKPPKVLKKVITIVYSGNDDFLASQLIPPKLTKKQLKRLAQPLS
jgi:hypothetical protein